MLALRDALHRISVFHPDRGIEECLSDINTLNPFVPPLRFRESLTGVLRPSNFVMLLFGRNDQARRLMELLDVQSWAAFDKDNRSSPNAVEYPSQALYEAMVNALAHRDHELSEPSRINVFSDRIEVLSPGSLPNGMSIEELRGGHAPSKWRNQSLARFSQPFAIGPGAK